MTLVSPFFVAVLLLALAGLLNLHSATQLFQQSGFSPQLGAQLAYHGLGFVLMLILSRVKSRRWEFLAYSIYAVSVLLLIAVLVAGQSVNGSQSWLGFGSLRVQPSEFAKIGLVLALCRHLSRLPRGPMGLWELAGPFLITLLPMGLVVLQGDLGTSLFFGLIFLSLVFAKGLRWQLLVLGLLSVVLVSGISYQYFLKPYQKKRIVSFLDPELDPRGSGYHLVQSKIATGSGGILGSGYLRGKSHKLKFLPERHTDFIFPVLAEEWGFLGCLAILGLYTVLLLSILYMSHHATTVFAAYTTVALGSLFFWHLVANVGGVLGLIPLTGVPLVFMSYGGSAVITAWLAIGILLSLRRERGMFF